MPQLLPILVGCEYSDTVASAFRAEGFEAHSCDLRATEGDPRWHIQDDIRNHLQAGRWLAMVCHPYCTYNTLAGIRWMYHPEDTALPQPDRRRHPKYPNRMRDFLEGALLFSDLMAAPIEFIGAENSKPHGLAMSVLGRPTQTVQPYDFGSPFTKGATLWLKNLPKLIPTHTKTEVLKVHGKIEARCHLMPPGPEREKERYRFDPAVASAMAKQWGGTSLPPRPRSASSCRGSWISPHDHPPSPDGAVRMILETIGALAIAVAVGYIVAGAGPCLLTRLSNAAILLASIEIAEREHRRIHEAKVRAELRHLQPPEDHNVSR